MELSGPHSRLSPLAHPVAITGVFEDTGIRVTVGDEYDTLGVHGHPRDHPQFPLFSWRMNRQSRTREGEPRSPVEEGVQLRGVSLASTLGEKGQAAEQRETSD